MRRLCTLLLLALAPVASATVTTTVTTAACTCTGAQIACAVPFPFLANGDLAVTYNLGSLALGTDYTVTGAGGSSGTVTLNATGAAKCVSGTLTVKRSIALTQPTNFRTQGPFAPATHERAFDRTLMAAQQADRRVADAEATHAADKAAQATRDATQDSAAAAVQAQTLAGIAGINNQSHTPNDVASVLAYGSTTARTLTARFADVVWASDFGVICDGVTNNTPDGSAWGLKAMRAYLRANPGKTVIFPGGTCAYTDNTWLFGVKRARLIGQGTTLLNTHVWQGRDIDTVGLVINKDYFHDLGDGNNPWAAATAWTTLQYYINTAAALSTSVTATTVAEAGNFAAGDWALIHGYVIYPGGFPPSARYFEIRQVASANAGTGAITFTEPIRNAYDSRWYEYSSSGYGKPKILKLSRPGNPGFVLTEDLYMEDFVIAKNAAQPWYFGSSYGALYAIAGKNLTFVRVRAGAVTPSEAERVTFTDCDIETTEPDKLVHQVVFDRSRIGKITGGTGVDHTFFRDSEIYTSINYEANFSVSIEGGGVWAYSGSGYKANVTGRFVKIKDVSMYREPSEAANSALLHGGVAPVSMTALDAGVGYITAALNVGTLEPFKSTYVGQRISKADHSNWGIVTAVYWDGANAKIEATFQLTPVIGEVYQVRKQGSYSLEDVIDLTGSEHTLWQQNLYPGRAERYRNNVESGRVRQIVVPLPESGGDKYPYPQLDGYVLRITAVIIRTAAATALRCYSVGDVGTYAFTINAATAGVRIMDGAAGYGGVAGDAIGATALGYYDHYVCGYTSGPGGNPFPGGWLIFDVLPYL